MKRILMTAAALAVLITGSAMAEDFSPSSMALGIEGSGLYSFATAASQKNGVIGGAIENITNKKITVTHADSDAAERTELHTHLMEDGVMKMRQVESYTIDANSTFKLGPRAEHIMLFDLKAPLKQGSVFSVRLYDESGANIEVPVLVRAPGDIPDDADAEDAPKMDHSAHHKHEDHNEHGSH